MLMQMTPTTTVDLFVLYNTHGGYVCIHWCREMTKHISLDRHPNNKTLEDEYDVYNSVQCVREN